MKANIEHEAFSEWRSLCVSGAGWVKGLLGGGGWRGDICSQFLQTGTSNPSFRDTYSKTRAEFLYKFLKTGSVTLPNFHLGSSPSPHDLACTEKISFAMDHLLTHLRAGHPSDKVSCSDAQWFHKSHPVVQSNIFYVINQPVITFWTLRLHGHFKAESIPRQSAYNAHSSWHF